jgi:hypothetical protein
MMMVVVVVGLSFISSLVLPLLKIRDEDPFNEISFVDLVEVSPSPSAVSHVIIQFFIFLFLL